MKTGVVFASLLWTIHEAIFADVNAMIEDQEPFEGEPLLDTECFKQILNPSF